MKLDSSIVLILFSVIGGGFGQVLLKKGMIIIGPLLDVSAQNIIPTAIKVITNPFVFGGLAVYGFSTALWLVALSRVELSFAYPFVSLSYIIMVFASWLLFQESVSALRLVGIATVLTGVIIISQS